MVTRFFPEIISQYLQFLFAAQEIRQKGLIASLSFLAEESASTCRWGKPVVRTAAVIHKVLIFSRTEKGIEMILYILKEPCGKWRDH